MSPERRRQHRHNPYPDPSACIPLREHLAELAAADRRLLTERDRRYAEVAEARAEALKVAQAKDAEALELARAMQNLKDERATDSRDDFAAFAAAQGGRRQGATAAVMAAYGGLTLLVAVAGIVVGRLT